MKKALASILAASMALSLAACGGSGSSGAAASPAQSTASTAEAVDLNQEAVEGISDDAVLRVAIDGEPDSLFAAYQ